MRTSYPQFHEKQYFYRWVKYLPFHNGGFCFGLSQLQNQTVVTPVHFNRNDSTWKFICDKTPKPRITQNRPPPLSKQKLKLWPLGGKWAQGPWAAQGSARHHRGKLTRHWSDSILSYRNLRETTSLQNTSNTWENRDSQRQAYFSVVL